MDKETKASSVQSLERALDLMEALVNADEPLGITELSHQLDLHKSTVYRLLATLRARGYVAQDAKTNNYKPGMKLFEIGSAIFNKMDLRAQAKPLLEQLMQETKETIHLGILDDHEVVYIDKVESPETIRMYSRIGRRVPAHSTSLGKILLAYSPEEIIDETIKSKGLPQFTQKTITDPAALKEHLKLVHTQGYSVDDEEQELEIRCIAGPVLNYDGQAIAAFSISGPVNRMTQQRVSDLASLVVDYSRKLSAVFGYTRT